MKSPTLLICCLLALPAWACQSAGGSPHASSAARSAIKFQSLASGNQSGLAKPQTLVIRTAAGWQNEWTLHQPGSATPLPAVDFTSEMVVVVALGETPGSDASVEIQRIVQDSGFVQVEARTRASNGKDSGVHCQPFHMVKLARNDAPVQFQVTQ